MTHEVWSCGGGTQSAAIAALIVQGRLPKPDLLVIADTEREKKSTWDYLDGVLRPAMATIGLQIERVLKSDFATDEEPDVFTNWGQPGVLIPAFKSNEGAAAGRVSGFCSDRWKRRIIQRWLRTQGVEKCNIWLGISTDEMSRVRTSDAAWYQNRYVLIFDVPMSRGECIRLVTDTMGWPEPPQSSCWMCPNHDDRHWLHIKTTSPEEFEKACQFEREMQERRPDFYLHRSCKPLGDVQFDTGQLSLALPGCDSGHCFV